MVECLSCGRRQEPRLICADCGTPLSAALDSFAALGFPRKLSIDLAALERSYHELSRKIHPDRFASREVAIRDASLRATALLTRSNLTTELKAILSKIAYLRTLIRDVDRALENSKAA